MVNFEDSETPENRENGWTPTRGKVMQIEFDKRILSDIRRFAEEDGVNSLYQMIRNICWKYVQDRKNGGIEQADNGGKLDRMLSLYRKKPNFRRDR